MPKFLEAGFDQSLVMSSRVNSTVAAEGACHNFSLHWLRMILGNPRQQASQRMDVMKKKSGGMNIVLQQAFVSRWGSDGWDFENADAMVLRLRGLKAASAAISYEPFSQSRLKGEFKNPGSGGFVYSFWFTGSVQGASGGSHSIAFYRSGSSGGSSKDGFVYIFDPNYGEFMVLFEKFDSWFNDFRQLYGPFTNHILKQVTVIDKDST